MIRTVFFAVYFVVCMLAAILALVPYYLLTLVRLVKTRDRMMSAVATAWARMVVWGTGSKVEVKGRENIPEGSVLFVGNHQSNLDIPIVMASIRRLVGFIAKKELKMIPLLNFWMDFVHCIYLDRKSLRKSAQGIDKGVEYLKKGFSMVIFPEGHRSKGPEMAKFKRGSFKLGTLAGAVIVPLTVSGSYHILEEKGRIVPSHVKLTIHPPIQTALLTEQEKEELSDRVEKLISSAL